MWGRNVGGCVNSLCQWLWGAHGVVTSNGKVTLQQCEKQKALHHSIYWFHIMEGSRHLLLQTFCNLL